MNQQENQKKFENQEKFNEEVRQILVAIAFVFLLIAIGFILCLVGIINFSRDIVSDALIFLVIVLVASTIALWWGIASLRP